MSKRDVASTGRQIQGYKSQIKGLHFERKVADYFSSAGWTIKGTRRRMYGWEIDIYGVREDILGVKSYLLVECKSHKNIVSKADVMSFMKKLNDFHKGLPQGLLGEKAAIKAVIAHTGEVDRVARDVAQNFKPKIEFKKF